MLVIAAVLLVVLGFAVHGVRTSGGAPRWPFLLAALIAGGALSGLVLATVIALGAGRDAWNGWVSGSRSSETVTLWVVLVAGPVILVGCGALVATGLVLRTRHRVASGRASSR